MPFQELPRWIQTAAFLLAINAGMINVLGLITVLHQSVSHMTGNVSVLAMAIIQWDLSATVFLMLITLCYVIGSFYSGWILGSSHFAFNRRYGAPMSLVAFFILLSWLFLPYFPRYGLLWAATAMGVQNAMVSHYKGAIIRTTHLSGVLTDLGLALGYKFRGLKVDTKRVILHLLIFFGFLIGGMLACFIYPYLKLNAFLVPAILSFIMSIVYWAVYFKFKPKN